MNLLVSLYDAFAMHAFEGNVAGVVLEASKLSARTMQKVAAELNAPTTGFVVGCEPGSPPTFTVRYFTPRQEIALCGHVTVAVCTALVDEGRCTASPEGTELCLRTAAGPMTVRLLGGKGTSVTVEMEQAAASFETPNLPGTVQEVLGRAPIHPGLPIEIACTGLRHLLVPFREIGGLTELRPDFKGMARLSRALQVDTVGAFAVSPDRPAWVRMRDFCPAIGADEEPASGTTGCAVACYLARHGVLSSDARGKLDVQVVQGVEMGRPSRLEIRVHLSDGVVRRVHVRGRAVRVLRGEFNWG